MPMRTAEQLNIALDDESLQPAFNASGQFKAHRVRVSIDAKIGDGWAGIGVVEVLVPDTELSRRPDSHVPFLLGRDGFFDKYSACFDEAGRAAWLRRVGGSPAAATGWPVPPRPLAVRAWWPAPRRGIDA